MKRWVITIILAGGTAVFAGDYKPVDGFAGFDFQQGNQTMSYRLLIPEKLEAGKRYPLVLFMHGMGSIGSDNKAQLFLAGRFAQRPEVKNQSVFVLAPQCPITDRWVKVADWNEAKHVFRTKPTPALKMAMAILDEVIKTYPIDPARVYVGGVSMGGFATWELLARRPGFFAAAFPICGGGCMDKAAAIAQTPIWTFHGTVDSVVLPCNSQAMVAAVKQAGGEVKYTEYPGVKHNAWDPALAEATLYQWIFEHKR